MMYPNLSASYFCPAWEKSKIQKTGNIRAFNHIKIIEHLKTKTESIQHRSSQD